ncbi:hypothetical protein THRCLA_07099 [Thraustotheca clavata]|uniref:Uncharacterized protein n=1 Tax=Thraustotheca clavata TaxID=74557 RepID=A0A1V9ZGI2_9STRA|nr:hypothetical protein THRCLA_07099 [Thraustotheca clavata]
MHVGQALVHMPTEWLTFKLIDRLSLSAYIVWCMWNKYYCHYIHLAENLRLFGIRDTPKVYEFEIVVGDPTSIILLIQLSLLCLPSISGSLVGIKEFLLACMYLSRTLWFAYGFLCVASYLLKKFHPEEGFHGVDPTLTAIAVSILAGPFTFFQTRTEMFVHIYNYLFLMAVDVYCMLSKQSCQRFSIFTDFRADGLNGLKIGTAVHFFTMALRTDLYLS